MKNALTASERRGILVVAALALLITGAGWVVSVCQRNLPEEDMPEVEVLVRGDSVTDDGGSKKMSGKTRKKKKEKSDSLGNKSSKTPKKYRRRSPRDEAV